MGATPWTIWEWIWGWVGCQFAVMWLWFLILNLCALCKNNVLPWEQVGTGGSRPIKNETSRWTCQMHWNSFSFQHDLLLVFVGAKGTSLDLFFLNCHNEEYWGSNFEHFDSCFVFVVCFCILMCLQFSQKVAPVGQPWVCFRSKGEACQPRYLIFQEAADPKHCNLHGFCERCMEKSLLATCRKLRKY